MQQQEQKHSQRGACPWQSRRGSSHTGQRRQRPCPSSMNGAIATSSCLLRVERNASNVMHRLAVWLLIYISTYNNQVIQGGWIISKPPREAEALEGSYSTSFVRPAIHLPWSCGTGLVWASWNNRHFLFVHLAVTTVCALQQQQLRSVLCQLTTSPAVLVPRQVKRHEEQTNRYCSDYMR